MRAWESLLPCTWLASKLRFTCDPQKDMEVFMKEHTGQHSYQETGAHTSTPPRSLPSLPKSRLAFCLQQFCPILNLGDIFSLVTITCVGLIHVHSKFPWVCGVCCINVGGCWVAASVKHAALWTCVLVCTHAFMLH